MPSALQGQRASSPSSPSDSVAPSATRSRQPRLSRALLAWVLALAVTSILITPVTAQETITLSFLDESGQSLKEQTITRATCTLLETPSPTTPDPEDPEATPSSSFVSISASDQQAGLNLYSNRFCQVLEKSAAGRWNQVDAPNVIAVRWEGTTTDPPGTLNPNGYPPNMAVQTEVPGVNEDGSVDTSKSRWVMDPSKGKVVVVLVALVLIVGIAIGIHQVYKAAQYKPPPKPVKTPKIGLVGGKKVKKKQAYYKKGGPIPPPAGSKEQQSLLLESSPQGTNRSSMNSQQQHLQPMQERSRNDILPVPASSPSTAPSPNTPTFNSGRRNDVLIDIQDNSNQGFSSTFRGPLWQGGAGGSSSGGGGGGGFQGPSTGVDLIQFGNDGASGPAPNPYRTGPSYSSQPTGRSGEVLVPMHQLSHRPPPSPTRMNGRSP